MGAYLSEPVTAKVSTDESSDQLIYGASSMQGWRVSQEDAHNAILKFEGGDSSFFGVYDGHGGHEVANYASLHLPDYIRSRLKGVDDEDIVMSALRQSFLLFDAKLATEDVINELKIIAGKNEEEESDAEGAEEVDELCQEAHMPLEQVIAKYKAEQAQPNFRSLRNKDTPVSPYINAKTNRLSQEVPGGSGSSKTLPQAKNGPPSQAAISSGSSVPLSASNGLPPVNGDINSEPKPDADSDVESDDDDGGGGGTTLVNGDGECKPEVNGEVGDCPERQQQQKKQNVIKGECENGELVGDDDSKLKSPGKGKGKSKGKDILKKSPEVVETKKKKLPQRVASEIYRQLLAGAGAVEDADESEEDDDDDDEDENFEGEDSESEEDDDEDGEENNFEGAEDEEEAQEEEEEEDDEDDDELGEEEENDFEMNMKEEPGSDSGCTSVVALVRRGTLYVANIGDSRCVVCEDGKAVDMSEDHKPEDDLEKSRIVAAGGQVTPDGRVNGGLNLSRAFGDHVYKQKKELEAEEQMISAEPDVRTLKLDYSKHSFMVLACDGIWNSMSSQAVVDFVKERLHKTSTTSKICEELFDNCIAPHTLGDGTGCDNMTCIIVKFPTTKQQPVKTEQRGKENEVVVDGVGDSPENVVVEKEKSQLKRITGNEDCDDNNKTETKPAERSEETGEQRTATEEEEEAEEKESDENLNSKVEVGSRQGSAVGKRCAEGQLDETTGQETKRVRRDS